MIGWYLGQRPTVACLWHAIPRGVWGHAPPQEILKMCTLGDAVSLILGAKSSAFRTDFYQVTGNKVMMNCSLDLPAGKITFTAG